MITKHEKEALLQYLEFLLVKQFLEPIIDKHVNDPDVVSVSYDTMNDILRDLDKTIDGYQEVHSVDIATGNK